MRNYLHYSLYMATLKSFIFKTFFYFMDESFSTDFVLKTMIKSGYFLWVFLRNFVFSLFGYLIKHLSSVMMKAFNYIWDLLCNFMSSLFGHLIKHLERSHINDAHENNPDTSWLFHEQEDLLFRSSNMNFDGFCEEEKSEFTFGFKFQMKEDDLINYNGVSEKKSGEKADSGFMENRLKTTTMNTSKYQFVSGNHFGGFVAEPEPVSFKVHELYVEQGSNEDDSTVKKDEKSQSSGAVEVNVEEQVKELNVNSNHPSKGVAEGFMETEVSSGEFLQNIDLSDTDAIDDDKKADDLVKDDSCYDEQNKFPEENQSNLGENGVPKKEQVNWLGEFFLRNESLFSQKHELHSFDSELDSDDSIDGFFSISPQNLDSMNIDFSSAKKLDAQYFTPSSNEACKEKSMAEIKSSEEIDDDDDDDYDDYIDLEPQLKVSEKKQWNSDQSNEEQEFDSYLKMSMESETEFSKSAPFDENNLKLWEYDSDEEDDEDVLLEHKELVDQMKMELKNARTGGLPTILEESETPRSKEDLKPLKIDEKLDHRDQMAEIQKFHKSYTEKMRKLDILNYQTLQAINFLRMKHPDQLNTEESSSLSVLKSVLLPSFWPCKLRRIYADPTLKSISELQRDLEIVYVGQTCLSWEILHWQYKKVKELEEVDPQGDKSYNQVAIEFQQFQVVLQRFTEDENFQGPRVQIYAKQRCDLRGLLQVPAIKDDNLKEKKSRKIEDNGDAVSISMLADMIKESMRVFWSFLQSDKDSTNLILSIILQGSKAYLQDPGDHELLMDIKTSHQKKEKKLKDMVRTGNCIVKKFKKHQESETILDENMFVSQVELRLISRVLSLPRLTRDQLFWCQNKLNNVVFIDGMIRLEESLFLLFPC